MKGGILLDGVVLECVTIFELLTSEDETLLIWWDTFLILDLSLDVFDSVGWFDLECDVFACECLDEDLHTTTKTENEMECRILLDGVVLKCVAVFELLACKDQTLLIWWKTFLVLDLSLDVLDTICWFNFECDMFACECLDEDLHLSLIHI